MAQEPRSGYRRQVIALDPADGTEAGAEHGLVGAGFNLDMHFYVFCSEGLRTRPWEFLGRAVELARERGATIVVEKNHGGAYLIEVLEQVLRHRGVRVGYRQLATQQHKLARAEPVAALYEQGKVRHVGQHPELEDH